MSSTPAQRFECPRCRSSYDQLDPFCRECGADMTRAAEPVGVARVAGAVGAAGAAGAASVASVAKPAGAQGPASAAGAASVASVAKPAGAQGPASAASAASATEPVGAARPAEPVGAASPAEPVGAASAAGPPEPVGAQSVGGPAGAGAGAAGAGVGVGAGAAEVSAAGVSASGSSDGVPIADRRIKDSNQTWLGKVVDGRYRVLEVIGRGGMGVVYRVEHLRMGKIAAMKVLHRDLAQDPDVVGRFEREAAAISKLHHPHTVQVFDFGTAQGALYLIMELVRGRDLARIIERDGPMPWARAAPLLAQICGALSEAHELGIVHRDLKPENVLITRSTAGRDYAKVLDFGLAKLDQRNAPKRETERQAIVGTPYFMAPEQIRGDDVDARTDVYSFGALMFELLTGQHLYTGSTAVGVLTKHLTADADAPSMRAPRMGIPPEVDHLCRKALQRDPDKRWQTAAELGAAIEEVYAATVGDATGQRAKASRDLVGGALPFDDTSSDLRLRRSDLDAFERGLRRRQRLVLGGMGLLAVGGAAAAALYLTRPPPTTDVEREPNDEPAQADRIAAGTEVKGYLGKRRSPTEGDRDVYTLQLPGGGRRVVSVSVSAIPNLDLNLSINNAAVVDEGGVGVGEVVHRRAVSGPVTITIAQTMAKDQKLPVENVSDPYTLVVTEEVPEDGEIEPNNMEADATELAPGRLVRGYLDARADVDVLRWSGPAGTFDVVVRVEGVPLQWRVGDGARRTPGAAKVELQPGDVIWIERRDRDQPVPAAGPLPGRDAPWTIVVGP